MSKTTSISFIDKDGIQRIRHWPLPVASEPLRLLQLAFPDPGSLDSIPCKIVYNESDYRHVVSDADSSALWNLKRKLEVSRYNFLQKNEIVHEDRRAITRFDIFLRQQMDLLKMKWRAAGNAAISSNIGRDWAECYLLDAFLHGDRPSLFQSLGRVALAGLCPLVWRGSWPNGFCYAYCPPDHPWATSGLPAAWQPSPAALKAGTTKPKPTKPLELEVPDVPAASFEELKHLIAIKSAGEALETWWSDWAETPSCREVLRALCARVRRLECDKKMLRIVTADRFSDGEKVFEANAPFTGALKPMPLSAARLIRRHAGLVMRRSDTDRLAIIPPFERGRFQVEFELWWTPDPWNADEPFRKPPLVPCVDENDIWVYHQLRARHPGEPELRRISHDGGDLQGALPYGAGGVALRLIAEQVVAQDPNVAYDFGLRSTDEKPDRG